MINNTFTLRGTNIDVFIDNIGKEDSYFEFIKAGVKYRLGIRSIPIIKKGKSIPVEYYSFLLDNEDRIITSSYNIYEGNLKGEYDFFYDKTTVETSIGVDFDKASLNGLMEVILEREFNEKIFCYNPFSGYTFFQPITFDTVVTGTTGNSTIIVNVVDGIGTFRYNINDGIFNESNVFNDLNYGIYKIGVKTTEDNIPFYKTINIS